MKELDVNTQLKNAIEEEKLQHELFKLSRSGRRATHQIDKIEQGITQHFLEVTCKTNKVTDVRKERTFQLMNLGHRPATTGTGTRRTRTRGGGRPASAVHFIPSTEINPEEKEVLYTDNYGRPDIERIHRERADKFYHHKIDKLMDMMNERTSKRRAKSAPATRVPPPPQYNINNLPDTILENRPMTRGEAEYEQKKMRATLTKQPSMLYGDVKEDTVVRKTYNPDRVGSAIRRRDSHGRSSSAQGGRRASNSSQERRPSTTKERRASTAKDRKISTIQETSRGASNERRSSTGQGRRSGPAPLPRRPSFRAPVDDSDVSSYSDSDTSDFITPRRQPPPGSPPPPDQDHYNALGLKLKEFQYKKYPSRFLDPNPDFYSRQKPFPVLFDRHLKKAYDDFCSRIARVRTISQTRADLEGMIAQSQIRPEEKLEIWEAGYVRKEVKEAWSKDSTTPRGLGSKQNTRTSWDTGPKF